MVIEKYNLCIPCPYKYYSKFGRDYLCYVLEIAKSVKTFTTALQIT